MLYKNTQDWHNKSLPDGGPVYMETGTGEYLVEPWNSLSSLLILIPAVYWILRLQKEKKTTTLMLLVSALIITGGIGSALFHGLRAYWFFLIMDVLPSAILTLTLAVYFWMKVLKRWLLVLMVFIPLVAFRMLAWRSLPEFTAINISYFITGASVGLPILIYLLKTDFSGWTKVVATIVSFSLALLFRQIDYIPVSFLPMGTHFLWHTFSAVGAYFILEYLYMVIPVKVRVKQ